MSEIDLEVIGLSHCQDCEDLKDKLIQENVPFRYRHFDELTLPEKRRILTRHRKPDGTVPFPIILGDEEEVEKWS